MLDRAESSDPTSSFGDLVGRSPAMRRLFAECARVANEERAAAIAGEPGTGKDALARALHRASVRAQGPLVTVDCSGPSAVVELELFGRAAGDLAARAGALELARGGSLLLDHCAELPLPLQPRLAEALASAASGGPRPIASSREPLAIELDRGRLHPSLFEVLRGAALAIPALRDRRDDIPLLARHLLARSEDGRAVTLSTEALELLTLHDWPGNVRELRNVLERFVLAIRSGDPLARRLAALAIVGDVPAAERRERPSAEIATFEPGASYREERARFEAGFERRYVAWLLERHDGNLSAAARAAEMDRKYLDKLARRHGLKPTR